MGVPYHMFPWIKYIFCLAILFCTNFTLCFLFIRQYGTTAIEDLPPKAILCSVNKLSKCFEVANGTKNTH